MRANYDESLRRLPAHEGGYTNHRSDPGGPTNFGITIADYRRAINPAATAIDVRKMKLDEAKAIYRQRYWDAQRCDELPAGVDYAVFDYGVNSGVGRSGRVLRRVLSLDDASPTVTAAVIAAANAQDPREVVARICDERLAFLKRLKTWPVFGAGWGRRVAEVRAVALAMAVRSTAAKGASEQAPGKTVAPVAKAGGQVTAGGIVAAGAAAAGEAHRSGARPGVVATILVVTAALAACGWLAWRWHQRRRQQASV